MRGERAGQSRFVVVVVARARARALSTLLCAPPTNHPPFLPLLPPARLCSPARSKAARCTALAPASGHAAVRARIVEIDRLITGFLEEMDVARSLLDEMKAVPSEALRPSP